MTILCATDLDRTLIYSRRAAGDVGTARLVTVERHEDRDASFLTDRAAAGLRALQDAALLVPVTTRTPEQWRRIRLPGPSPRYAVTANGGILLVDGAPDERWDAVVATALARVAPVREVWAHAAAVCRPEWTSALRNAHDLFCYAVLRRELVPAGMLAETAAWAADRGWRLSLQGRKLYWVPAPLTKSAAVREVARRAGTRTLLAAGDSLLDADLLDAADAGIVARDGELVASGWRSPRVAVTARGGALGGEEIVAWLLARVGGGGISPGAAAAGPPG